MRSEIIRVHSNEIYLGVRCTQIENENQVDFMRHLIWSRFFKCEWTSVGIEWNSIGFEILLNAVKMENTHSKIVRK